MIEPRHHIGAMQGYALADLPDANALDLVSLCQTVSLRPPSAQAIRAGAEALRAGALYPDPDWSALRLALARLHAVPAAQILCGNGSLDLIAAIARVYAGPGRAVIAPAHAYPFFRTAAQMTGSDFRAVPERALCVDVERLARACPASGGVLFVANPGNPTGTYLGAQALRWLADALPDNILLVIDEAYAEFAPAQDQPLFDLVRGGRAAVLRTFSKAYGLAGCRVGWGLFPPDIAAELRKVLNPNNISAAGQAAALAALGDQPYMRQTCEMTATLRGQAAERLAELGFDVVGPSATNFVLLRLGTAAQAEQLDARLRAEGVILRRQGGAGLPHCLRMTIPAAPGLSRALDALGKHAKEALE